MLRFRCHTGPAYSAASLLSATMERIEQNFGHAMASLEEAAMLMVKLGQGYSESDNMVATTLQEHARTAARHSKQLREMLQQSPCLTRMC